MDNQAVSDPVFYLLVFLYAVMIVGSVAGNLLVITAVLRSPNMRKVRVLEFHRRPGAGHRPSRRL